MKHGMILALAALAAGLSSSPALAAYNGFYFGLEGGYESNDSGATAVQPDTAGSLQERRGGTGPAYGLFAGYAFELSKRWFAGIEGSASLSNAGFRFITLDGAGAPIEGQGVRVATKQSFALSAQLGYMVTDRLGVYGRLGLPGAKISYKSLEGGGTIASDHSYFSSYLAGGGLQYALGEHLFTRLEYTYSDLEIGPFGALDGRHRVMLGIGLGY
jgi:outer membrane immunogenic protein